MSETNAQRTRRYLEAVASLQSAEAVRTFYAPDVVFHELPNRIAPHGRVRRVGELLAAFEQGQQLLSAQRYDVKSVIEMGDQVAAEVEWTGTLAVPFQDLPAGHELKAFIGMFLTFKDGKIVSQRNYDCYPPFS
jgi:ketosteroid isomerase-like protein